MAMRLFMVRHGESENNLKKMFTGWVDSPLTEKGYKDAESIRPFMNKFKFDKVYSSDLCRAVETAKTVLPDQEPIETPLLREYNVGSLGNQSWEDQPDRTEEIRAAIKAKDYTPFGGENVDIVMKRLREFLKSLEAQNLENVAAFAHGGVIMSMLFHVLGQHDTAAFRRPNCMIAVFDYINERWVVSSLIDPALLNASSDAEPTENDKL